MQIIHAFYPKKPPSQINSSILLSHFWIQSQKGDNNTRNKKRDFIL